MPFCCWTIIHNEDEEDLVTVRRRASTHVIAREIASTQQHQAMMTILASMLSTSSLFVSKGSTGSVEESDPDESYRANNQQSDDGVIGC